MKLNVLWGLLLGLFFTLATQAAFWALSAPQPYKDVVVTEVERTDDGYVVHANFIKTECTFKRLEVFGINTGVPIYLKWSAQDGSPATDYDPATIGRAAFVYVSDESGGAQMAFSDGTDWRRFTDRAVVT